MTETIVVTGNDGDLVSMFLIEAMAEVDPDLTKFFPNMGQPGWADAEVCLTINGIEAPFTSVARGFLERLQADMERMVLEKAEALITEAGLVDLMHEIQNSEWRIKAALEKALEGVK